MKTKNCKPVVLTLRQRINNANILKKEKPKPHRWERKADYTYECINCHIIRKGQHTQDSFGKNNRIYISNGKVLNKIPICIK